MTSLLFKCSECSAIVQSSDISFRVRCDCHPDDSCPHGICSQCLQGYIDDDEKEKRE